ncbi:MAG: MFS transporter [Halobacteria archaeon]
MAPLLDRLPAPVRAFILPWNVNLVCAMGLVSTAAGAALYTTFTSPGFRERISIDVTTLGVAGALGSGATILGLPLWGAAADRWGRKPVLLVGALAGPPLALWLLALSTGPEFLLRSLLAGFLGAGGVAGTALIADSAPLHQRAEAMSASGATVAAGFGAGFLAAGYLLSRFGFEGMVPLVALLGLIPVALALALREVPRSSPAGSLLSPLRGILRERRMRTLFLVAVPVVMPVVGVGVVLLPFLQDAPPKGLGLSLDQIARALLPAGLVALLVFLPAVWRTDRTLRRRRYILAGALLAGVPWLLLPWAGGLAGLALLAAAIGAGAALAGPAIGGLLADIMPPEHRGSGFGLLSFAISLAFIGGAPLGGFLYDRFGFATAFYALALVALPGHALALKRRALLMPN